MGGWVDGSQSWFKDCLQQSKRNLKETRNGKKLLLQNKHHLKNEI